VAALAHLMQSGASEVRVHSIAAFWDAASNPQRAAPSGRPESVRGHWWASDATSSDSVRHQSHAGAWAAAWPAM
jgi:hypothetical protein